jgi:hypothetical protein
MKVVISYNEAAIPDASFEVDECSTFFNHLVLKTSPVTHHMIPFDTFAWAKVLEKMENGYNLSDKVEVVIFYRAHNQKDIISCAKAVIEDGILIMYSYEFEDENWYQKRTIIPSHVYSQIFIKRKSNE